MLKQILIRIKKFFTKKPEEIQHDQDWIDRSKTLNGWADRR